MSFIPKTSFPLLGFNSRKTSLSINDAYTDSQASRSTQDLDPAGHLVDPDKDRDLIFSPSMLLSPKGAKSQMILPRNIDGIDFSGVCGVSQYPGPKDQDLFVIKRKAERESDHKRSMKDDLENHKWDFYGVFDGHGTINHAAEICVETLCEEVVRCELQNEAAEDLALVEEQEQLREMNKKPTTSKMSRMSLPEKMLPSDKSIVEAFRKVEEAIVDKCEKENNKRTGTCAVCLFVHSPFIHGSRLQETAAEAYSSMAPRPFDEVSELGNDEEHSQEVQQDNSVELKNASESVMDITKFLDVKAAEEAARKKIEVKIAWTGDCRCLAIDENYSIVFSTTDHKVSSNEKERSRIEEQAKSSSPRKELLASPIWLKEVEEAQKIGKQMRPKSFIGKRTLASGQEAGKLVLFGFTNGISLQVSRSIGDPLGARSAICDPEIQTLSFPINLQLQGNQFLRAHSRDSSKRSRASKVSEAKIAKAKRNNKIRLVLASDGMWDVISNEQVTKFIEEIDKKNKKSRKKKQISIERVADMLAKQAKKRREKYHMIKDDITVMILEIPVGPF